MYGKPFNHKKPFGTVSGDDRFHFEQDGQVYDVQKRPINHLTGELLPLEAGAETLADSVDAAAPVAPATPENPEDDIPDDEKPFNLLAWAQNEPSLAKTPWEKVKAEAARLLDDMAGIVSKEAARKAILAKYGL